MNKNKMKNIIAIILLLGLSISFSITNSRKVRAKTYTFTASITPDQVFTNQNVTFQGIISNTGESSLGSTIIIIPTELTIISQVSILNPITWTCNLTDSAISISAPDGGELLSQNESITFTFDATTPSTPILTNWSIQATTSIQGGGVPLTFEGEQPSLSIISAPMSPPIIEASKGIINQEQTCLFTQYLGPSGGFPPYDYQWFESYNGENFTEILGATQPEYTFSPTTQTLVGTWQFKLNVTDSSLMPQTVSSNVINVKLNPKLIAPIITATPNQVSQSQSSILVSSSLSTGTPPYSYQWYQKVPGQNFSIVGDDLSTFSFPGSTITGSWMFSLRVSDNTGAKVNSTSVELEVVETQIFTITVTQSANGRINPNTCSVNGGSTQLFTISPDNGFFINYVLVDGISVGAVTSYNFVNIKSNHSIKAIFSPISYSVSVSTNGNGSVIVNPVKTSYYYGDTIELNAVPASGWTFNDWTGALVGSVNSSTLVVDGNKHITATFIQEQENCMVIAFAGQGGKITPSGIIFIDYNQSQLFSITPNLGYHIENVLINGSSVGTINSYTISGIVGDTTIDAIFAPDTLEIVSQLSDYGLMNPSGITYVEYGESQTFSISPSPGYIIGDVFVDGNSVGALDSYTFLSVKSNHTISANFAANSAKYNITVSSPFGSPTPSTQVKAGESFFASVISPIVDVNHRWVCTGYSVDNDFPVTGYNYTFVDVQSDHNITFFWEEQFFVTVILQNGLAEESGWYNEGSLISIPVTNTLTTESGMRKIFSGWTENIEENSSTSDQVLIDGSKEITATWKTQYQVTYNLSGNTLGVEVPLHEWVDDGAQATYEFPNVINNTNGDIRNILIKENRPNIVDSSCAITGFYQTQYLVTFTQNILDSNVSGTVSLFINGSEVEKKLPVSVWVNANVSISFSYISNIINEDDNKNYVLIDNSASPLSINGPITVYGNYQFQPSSSEFPLGTIVLLALPVGTTSIVIPLLIKRKNRKKKNNAILKQDLILNSNKVQTKEKIILETTKSSRISINQENGSTEKIKVANCPKNFGYLQNRPKDSILPLECLSCEKMNKCIENKI